MLSVAAANLDHRVFGGRYHSMRRAREFSPDRPHHELQQVICPESIFMPAMLDMVTKRVARRITSTSQCPLRHDDPSILAKLAAMPQARKSQFPPIS